MIIQEGYSKDASLIPEGIVITFGREFVEEKGGMVIFLKHFHRWMDSDDGLWLQKCKNRPRYENLLHVYIILENKLYGRCYYGGYQTGPTIINSSTADRSFSERLEISWPRILLGGSFERCPFKRELRGFQGFRYCTKLF